MLNLKMKKFQACMLVVLCLVIVLQVAPILFVVAYENIASIINSNGVESEALVSIMESDYVN